MKIFYLFSNWKWTGPAEPAVNLCHSLAQNGAEVWFFPGTPPKGDPSLVREMAQKKGLESTGGLYLKKHLKIFKNSLDCWNLKKLIKKYNPKIIHTNLQNDHLIGALSQMGNKNIKIVRSSYDDSIFYPGFRSRFLLQNHTDALITISDVWKEKLEKQYSFLSNKIHTIEVGVDLERFSLQQQLPDFRKKMGFTKDHFVVGMVARMQSHRKFDLFLEAILKLTPLFPHLRVLIVGRGTKAEEVAKKPVREMGLEDMVHFSGYLEGKEYLSALASFDVKILMVPGSDGSCRAVREAMAMKKAILVGNMGVLPELIEKSQGGEVFDYNLESLVEKLKKLLQNPSFRQEKSEKSFQYAQKNFQIEKTALKVLKIYEELL